RRSLLGRRERHRSRLLGYDDRVLLGRRQGSLGIRHSGHGQLLPPAPDLRVTVDERRGPPRRRRPPPHRILLDGIGGRLRTHLRGGQRRRVRARRGYRRRGVAGAYAVVYALDPATGEEAWPARSIDEAGQTFGGRLVELAPDRKSGIMSWM